MQRLHVFGRTIDGNEIFEGDLKNFFRERWERFKRIKANAAMLGG